MSIWEIPPVFFEPVTIATRFTNKIGEHPPLYMIIHGQKIVLSKEELTENNWLFKLENESEREIAQKQINTFLLNDSGTIIIKNN